MLSTSQIKSTHLLNCLNELRRAVQMIVATPTQADVAAASVFIKWV